MKAKSQAKAKAKPKIKITKEPAESAEPVGPEPVVVVEDKLNIDKNRQMANCPDCNLSVTVHTLTYIYKKEDIAKEHIKKKLKKYLN